MSIRSRVILIVVASLLASFTSYAAEKERSQVVDAHQHLRDRCVECHIDSVEIAQLVTVADDHCQQCHAEKNVAVAVKSTKKSSPKVAANVGMNLPHYYTQTLYGDAPGEMIKIPVGKFIRGTDSRLADEGPQHTLHLDTYYIDKYEVTNLQYKKFNDETRRRSPKHFRNRTFPQGKVDHPVTYVTWYDAEAYCQWAGKRMPTDIEWEKAARGTDGQIYAWGDEFSIEKANTPLRWESIGSEGDTTPVGAFRAGVSPYGLYDMSGNVWEWTSSAYKAYPGNTIFSESYGERYKVMKGGSWFDCSFYKCGISAPVFNRAFFARKVKNDTSGFRCAKSIIKQ